MNDRATTHPAWAELRHGGLLIAPTHVRTLFATAPAPLRAELLEQLRRASSRFETDAHNAASALLDVALHRVLGLGDPAHPERGHWTRGSDVSPEWTRRSVTGEAIKPRRVWHGANGATLPVFWSDEPRLGVGRGRRAAARVVEWLRQRGDRLALQTNGSQWRLVHASLDHEAWVESERDRWFEEGAEGLQLLALRALLSPATLSPAAPGGTAPLLAAIEASRRSQAELSSELGERVRGAVERLIREHGAALTEQMERDSAITPREIYRAATRVIMRMVVVLFAEARDLLPRSEELYLGSYGLAALREQLERAGAGGQAGSVRADRLRHRFGAWPRVLALFRLVHAGSGHPGLKVPRYGGELFEPGRTDSEDALARTVHVFESAALLRGETMSDLAVYDVLRLLTRSRVRVQAGRAATWVEGPVDFGDLSSEYIGILYEGLLDYELRRAADGDPVVFLAIGDEPALPLSRLEPMDDSAIAELVKKAGQKRQLKVGGDDEDGEGDDEDDEAEQDDHDDEQEQQDEQQRGEHQEPEVDLVGADAPTDSPREVAQARVLAWTKRAVAAGKLVAKPKSKRADALREYERAVDVAAARLSARVVLPGGWYLVRFGGTRKGSGTFYTRPQLAVPTVHRTLRPLAFEPPVGADGSPNEAALAAEWSPRSPDAILSLRVCDPACGSGSFPVAALRFLTESLFTSLLHHGWLVERDGRLTLAPASAERPSWLLECVSDLLAGADEAEDLLKRRLRRVVVERCLYGVDLDPLAVELAKLALWVETLDRELPFTFLDHKIRCGNSLVGCWLDHVREFPALAWDREGGDKSHTRGTHYRKEEWTKAIKAQRSRVKDDLAAHLRRVLSGQTSMPGVLATGAAESTHDEALHVFQRLHDLPLHDSAERARVFREEFRGNAAVAALRDALDMWCAQWFWPADQADRAPLPSQIAQPLDAARATAKSLAVELRFFHWELEFPDVFAAAGGGFDAVMGNPPWETLQPVSKEYFSNLDPLYRAYGKQQGLARQAELFAVSASEERAWLEYVARFKAYANFAANAAAPFGHRSEGKKFPLGAGSDGLHDTWRSRRARQVGFSDAQHPYREQGDGKPYTYKLFLEQAHALLKPGGLLGFIVPSGLYTDKGTGDLRRLFLERCCWRWLFGIVNSDGIFDIHRSFKFGPVIVQKGGRTDAVQTAFMRRDLKDWEDAERHAIPYESAQVELFSPRTRAILEIRQPCDLEILKKVYANGVLLGDETANGWGVRYAQGDFNMTSDSDKFRALSWYQAQGYRRDAYGRLLLADSPPAAQVAPQEIQGGAIPMEGGGHVSEASVRDVAFPLMQGVSVHQFEWVVEDRRGRTPACRCVSLEQQSVVPAKSYVSSGRALQERFAWETGARLAYRRIARTTDARTVLASPLARVPCGDSVFVFQGAPLGDLLSLTVIFNSWAYDFQVRARLGGTNLSDFVMSETAVCQPRSMATWAGVHSICARLGLCSIQWAPDWLLAIGADRNYSWRRLWAITPHERMRLRAAADAVVACLAGLNWADARTILHDCDRPVSAITSAWSSREADPKGFWRVDRQSDPERRLSVLSLVALRDLEERIAACGGDRARGIESFLGQNDNDGWMLPETLRLADYGLGHDDRALHAQPVRATLGERFLPWQLEQSVEESWAECHWHARNILGEQGYEKLERRLRGEEVEDLPLVAEGAPPGYPCGQERLIPAEQPNLFGGEFEDLPSKGRRKRS